MPAYAEEADGFRAAELRDLIGYTLNMLEPSYREIIRLIFIEEKSPAEAAEILGVTTQCVTGRVYRARRRFAELYAKARDGEL
jgi:DNA-directed RNA polymerase specialized sigma24 family protein